MPIRVLRSSGERAMLVDRDDKWVFRHDNRSMYFTKEFFEISHNPMPIFMSRMNSYIDQLLEERDRKDESLSR